MHIHAKPDNTFALNCTAKEMHHIKFVLQQYGRLQTDGRYSYNGVISRNCDDIACTFSLLETITPVCADSLDLIRP